MAKRLVVANETLPGYTHEARRVMARVKGMAQCGEITVIAPVGVDGPLMIPGVRHVDPKVPVGSDWDATEAVVGDATVDYLAQHSTGLAHCFGVRAGIAALMRQRRGLKVVIEPGVTPSQRLKDELKGGPTATLEDLVSLEDAALKRADAVIAHNPMELATLSSRGIDTERLWVVPDGLPEVQDDYPLPDLPQLVYIGELRPKDGIDMLLSALGRLSRTWRLLLCVPSGCSKGEVELQAARLGYANRITWAVFDESTALRVAGSQAVVVGARPCRALDGGGWLPEGVTWALACGRPLIAPESNVIRAVAGAGARYFAALDIDDLESTLEAVLSDVDERQHLRTLALERRASVGWEQGGVLLDALWRELEESA